MKPEMTSLHFLLSTRSSLKCPGIYIMYNILFFTDNIIFGKAVSSDTHSRRTFSSSMRNCSKEWCQSSTIITLAFFFCKPHLFRSKLLFDAPGHHLWLDSFCRNVSLDLMWLLIAVGKMIQKLGSFCVWQAYWKSIRVVLYRICRSRRSNYDLLNQRKAQDKHQEFVFFIFWEFLID